MNPSIENGIAIIGISGRFPGAENIKKFWDNIVQGKESIKVFKNEDLISAGISNEKLQSPHYIRARGVIDKVEFFDADFFGISPHEAQLMDPQHRLFLECSFEALENSCYSSDQYSGTIGVYGGASRSTYFLNHLYPNSDLMEKNGNYLIRIGNEQDFLTTKVSHRLNLKGPSLSIQTACSTSLAAVCIACNHLLTYQCDIALAGGASIYLPQISGYVHQEGMIFSSDGHCRPFDAEAEGTVPSNAVGVVVLKRLEEAIADRDNIYAIIRGYGLNNDGGEKINYSSPSVNGQMAAIGAAIAMADIDPATISYVETHGTGTFIGDPIEIEALTRAFRQFTQKQGFCAIGSVKSNIGHSMEGAGIVGLIKAVLSIHEKKIPPMLHFHTLNPHIDSKNSPFYVNTSLKEWDCGSNPRRASVSSFGIGGTNAHVVLEEAPVSGSFGQSNMPYLLILSAKTPSALNTIGYNLSNYLRDNPNISIADVSYSLQVGRKEFAHRRIIICRNREEAIVTLLAHENIIPTPQTPEEKILVEVGNSWLFGATVNWTVFWSHLDKEKKPCRIPLPTYPFEKKRYWIDLPSNIEISQNSPPIKIKNFSNIEGIILKIWKEFLGVETVGLNEDFFSIGGDSLLAIQVITQIETETGVSLSLPIFYQSPTISKLSFAIAQQILGTSCLVSLKKGIEKECPALFLIHAIDGNVLSYRELAEGIKFQGPIFGVQSSDTEQSEKGIEQIASLYIREIQKAQGNGPYFLCGSSFGGIVAYEMANQLKELGHDVGFLGIIDAINPQYDLVPKKSEWDMIVFFSELMEGKASVQDFSPEILLDKLLCNMGLSQLSIKQKQIILRGIQSRLHLLRLYEPKPYAGNTVFFEAKERFFRMKSVSMARTWVPLIKGKIEVHEIDGSHLTMLKFPHVTKLSGLLSLAIEKSLLK